MVITVCQPDPDQWEEYRRRKDEMHHLPWRGHPGYRGQGWTEEGERHRRDCICPRSDRRLPDLRKAVIDRQTLHYLEEMERKLKTGAFELQEVGKVYQAGSG